MTAKPERAGTPGLWTVGGASGLVAWLAVAVVAIIGMMSTIAAAHVPRAERVIDAVAEANVAGHRVRALRYRLKLHIGDGPPVAEGDLVSHPTGLARLELRASGGLIERHILLGDLHSAARNTRLLVRPRAFLPPIFVLQSSSGAVLEAALGTLGVDRDLIGLAPCGKHDCYVIGDPTRAVRRPLIAVVVDDGAEMLERDVDRGSGLRSDEDRGRESEASEEASDERPPQYFATLWVDTVDHRVRQIESRDGVRIVLGPYASFDRLSVPLWWIIEEPGKRPVRFEVEGVIEVNAPAAAFSKTWLMAPVTPPTNEESTHGPEGSGTTEPDPQTDPSPVSTGPLFEPYDLPPGL